MTPPLPNQMPTLRGLMMPVGLILLVSVALIAGVVVYAAQGQDRVATDATIHLAGSVIADKKRALAQLAREYTFWDEAVQNLVTTPDLDWADANIGTYMYENFGMSSSFVIDAQNHPVYGMIDGERTVDDPLTLLSGGATTLIERARGTEPTAPPVPVIGLLQAGDVILIAAASELKNYRYEDDKELGTPTGSLLILTQRMDDALLSEISENYLLSGLRLEPESSRAHREAYLPLAMMDGTSAGRLSWEVPSPGQTMLKQVLPGIILAFLVIAGLTYLLLNRGHKIVAATLNEIANRRRAEAQLIQFQKIQSLGNLSGGMAHNLNNLLYPILALSSRTRDELPPDSRGHERLEKVVEAGERAKAIVGQVLRFSHKNEISDEPIDIQASVISSLELMHSTIPTNIVVKEVLDTAIGDVRADAAQIGIIVMNLTSNAIDAMRDTTGEMAISLARVDVDAALAASIIHLNPGPYAKLTVQDAGLGMDDQTKQQIFDPFFTTKEVGDGTGLGLSSVFGIVSGLGGTIDVSSVLGAGTTIDVYLPLVDTPAFSVAS